MDYNFNSDLFVSTYDNCPFWSANFGYTLINEISYKQNCTVLDIGTGTGFPAIEIAERLGKTATIYAIDLWETALKRAALKAELLNVANIKFLNASVTCIPFGDNTFDLITSNNCLNNVGDYTKALSECSRVLKCNGQLIQTFNLPSTLKEFYDVFIELLKEKGMNTELDLLKEHIYIKRRSSEEMSSITAKAGFKIKSVTEHNFIWPFYDGTSFFNYSFIKLAFLPSWQEIIDIKDRNSIFFELEQRLNIYASENRGLKITIPYACIIAEKIKI